MKNKHFTIPIFIPEVACPNRCVFCNQYSISGSLKAPDEDDVVNIIDEHLKTLPTEDAEIEIGFFGGSFTGLDLQMQTKYLDLAQPYLKEERITGIRLSTRPDYINGEILDLLKEKDVKTIELGAQSMDDKVLEASGRGHTARDTIEAAKKISKEGFRLGLQMMIGLPLDSKARAINTAKKIGELKPQDVRVYPTLVVKGTELENMWEKGSYKPLSMDEAVEWSKEIFLLLEGKKINVIRMGLHPSEDLQDKSALVAGPFHQSFRELVYTEIWSDALSKRITDESGKSCVQIYVPVKELNYAIGYKGQNKKALESVFERVNFKADHKLHGRHFYVDYY